jgi:hypothetical protein
MTVIRNRLTRPATTNDVLNILKKKLISVDYVDTPFEEVIRDLREQLSINMQVYWPSLKSAGIGSNESITLKLDNVTAGSVIEGIVRYLSSGLTTTVGYQVDRGVVEIGLEDELVRRQVLKVYYVADLLHRRSTAGQFGYGGGGYNQSGFSGGRSSYRTGNSGGYGRFSSSRQMYSTGNRRSYGMGLTR